MAMEHLAGQREQTALRESVDRYLIKRLKPGMHWQWSAPVQTIGINSAVCYMS